MPNCSPKADVSRETAKALDALLRVTTVINRSLAERLVATAAGIALVAVAIGFAVHIIMAVWVPLVIILGCALAAISGVMIFRRSRGW